MYVCLCERVFFFVVVFFSVFEAFSQGVLEKCKYESVLRSSQRERILFDALSHRESHRGKLHYKKKKMLLSSVTQSPCFSRRGAETLYCIKERYRKFTSSTLQNKTTN